MSMPMIDLALSLMGDSRLCARAEEREEIERFRYQIYISELGKKLPWADHSSGRLIEPIDDIALHFYRRSLFGKMAASVRLHMLGPSHTAQNQALEEVIALCGLERLRGQAITWSYMSKLMVARDWRGIGVVPKLLTDVYHYGRKTFDARALFCHCTPKLVALYERIGLHRVGVSFEDAHVGTQVPMVLFLDDVEHFGRINSFLYVAARRYTPDLRQLNSLKTMLGINSQQAVPPKSPSERARPDDSFQSSRTHA